MEKYKNTVLGAILISEASHVFCCVLPTIFSIVSLMSGIGIISAMPAGWVSIHHILHQWELPMIGFSALVLVMGWGMHYYTEHMGPHEQHKHCCDGHCGPSEPKKNKIHVVLKIATALFVVNVFIYTVFHQGLGFNLQ